MEHVVESPVLLGKTSHAPGNRKSTRGAGRHHKPLKTQTERQMKNGRLPHLVLSICVVQESYK